MALVSYPNTPAMPTTVLVVIWKKKNVKTAEYGQKIKFLLLNREEEIPCT